MSGQSKKLKPLEDLKFDSVGEEFIILYEIIEKESEFLLLKEGQPSIEEIREEYSRIVNEQEVEEKYEKKSVYWSGDQERAIAEYITEKDSFKKDEIFRTQIYKPLKKLVENIIFTYKLFRSDVELRELQEDCMSFLITKMDRYDPSKGTRAFAFFGTIAKHYLMGEKKTSYKMIKSSVEIEYSNAEVKLGDDDDDKKVEVESEETNNVVFREIITRLEFQIDNEKVLPNDKKVIEAIIYIFKSHEELEIYNKNLLYHLIKERTGLQTKEITYSLSRIREFYRDFKQDFLKGLF
jgi:hypothetical protein